MQLQLPEGGIASDYPTSSLRSRKYTLLSACISCWSRAKSLYTWNFQHL